MKRPGHGIQCAVRTFCLVGFLVLSGSVPCATGAVSPDPEPEPARQRTTSNGAISGIVTDDHGAPLADIGVGAGDYDTLVGCGGADYWAGTGPDGSFQLDVPPGTYLVFVNSHYHPGSYLPEAYSGVYDWRHIGNATPVIVSSGQIVTGIDFFLPSGWTVSGRLVDDHGQPVPGAGGNIRDPDRNVEFGCALGFGSSNSDGTFRVNVPPGIYDLGFNGIVVRYGLQVAAHLDLGDVLFAPAPEPPAVFDPEVLEPGYTVETIVPGGANTPSDVAVLPDGRIYLAAIRSWNVYQVGAGSTLTPTAAVGVYALAAGPDGNLYGYFMPWPGPVVRITPQGGVTTVGYLPMTSCESTLAVAPNLDLWIGYNYCGGTGFGDATLYRMTQAGQLYTVAAGLPFGINGLDFDSGGQLYMTMGSELYRVSTANGSRTLVVSLPGPSTSHGLAIDPAGNRYISSPGDGEPDRILKVAPGGNVSVLASLPTGCLQGLDDTPQGDLIATMRCTGALYRVHPDGTWDTLLPGNGMATPQAMAFNLAGELLVNNDESGRIVKVVADRGEFFAPVISYIPPLGHLAFDSSGCFYFSEGAPGFVPRLVRVSPRGRVSEVTRDVSFPSGLAFTPDGRLYVAENVSGEISAVSPAGQVTTFVNGLLRPQSMAADAAGNLYVAAYEGPLNNPDDPADNPPSNRLWQIAPSGDRTLYSATESRVLAFSPAGELYITGPVGRQTGVLRVAPDGSVMPFARGFLSAVGLAFDLAGNLYVSDDWHNGIVRIAGFPRGGIQGNVSDAENAQSLAGATLTVVAGPPLILGVRHVTGDNGVYRLPAAPGTYTVTASAPGYRPASRQVSVQADVTVTVNLALMPWAAAVCLPLIVRDAPARR
jgi:sugar lactone lactonase YvrE